LIAHRLLPFLLVGRASLRVRPRRANGREDESEREQESNPKPPLRWGPP